MLHSIRHYTYNNFSEKPTIETCFYLFRVYLKFYAPEGTSGGILKWHRPSVRYKSCLSDSSSTAEANLMKLHRKIKENKKVFHAHHFSSYARVGIKSEVKIMSQQ